MKNRNYIFLAALILSFLSVICTTSGMMIKNEELKKLNKGLEELNTVLDAITDNQELYYGEIIDRIAAVEKKAKEIISISTKSKAKQNMPKDTTDSGECKLPDITEYDTTFKSYMDYRAITDKSSAQYKIQLSAWTDEYGFRRINNDYIAAMGTYYSDQCGARFKITFDTGKEITVIVGDIKQDIHTDETNRYFPIYDDDGNLLYANVLEFIVDTDQLVYEYKISGTVGDHNELKGNITKIERISEG